MTRLLLALSLALPLASVSCSGNDDDDDDDWGDADESGDPDRGGDSGGTDGADGGDGGADGGDGFLPVSVNGRFAAWRVSSGAVGVWWITGLSFDCGDCLFGFTGDFAVSSDSAFGSDFSRQVEWDAAGYVYTSEGEYWGYGGADGTGSADFYSYTYTSYLYYGYVNY